MPVNFAHPLYLLFLALIPIVFLLARRSLAGLGRGRHRAAVLLRAFLVGCVVLAIAQIQWKDEQDKLEVLFLLDNSRSIPEDLREQALAAIDAARKGMRADRDEASLIVFGKSATIEHELKPTGPARKQINSLVGVDQTNISAALDYALNSFKAGYKKRIVIFTDGNATTGTAREQIEAARERGVVIDVVPLRYNLAREAFIEKVVMPNEVKVGEPYVVRVVVRSLARTRATLELYENRSLVSSRKLSLEPGLRVETFARNLRRTGFFNVRAVLRTEEGGDTIYQNNQAFGFVYVRGQAKVLYIAGLETPEGTEQLRDAMALERINYQLAGPADVPKDANILQQYDAIILDNVPKYELTLGQQLAIESSVKNQGLGLVMIGGPDSFGAGGWEDAPPEKTPVERALPVYMEPKQKTIIPNGALAIIMHSCEFANGNDWGRKVTMKAVDMLSAKDYVGVVYYDMAGSTWRFPMQVARNKRALKAKIKGMEPGDMPNFDPSMRMAINGLVKVKASTKHMIILSDGDPSPPSPGLLKTCRDNKITITTIAIQPHSGKNGPEVALMKRIANATGGKFYYLTGPQLLPKIFIKETKRVARPLIRNIEFIPRVAGSSPVLKGFKDFPKLYGHVLTSPKKRATVVLETPEKEPQPILAHWQYGVGKSAAFTSDASPRWAGDWLEWAGYSNFWGQLIRWVSKDVRDAKFQVSAKVMGDRGKVVVDAVNEDGEFIQALTITGVVSAPTDSETGGKREIKLNLKQTGPGRYEGDFPVDAVGNYTLSLISSKDTEEGPLRDAITTGLVFPYSDEYRRMRSNDALLADISKTTRGRIVEIQKASKEEAAFFDHDLVSDDAMVERWPLLLLLALLLFPVDVFLRRVMLDYAKMWAWAKRQVGLGAGPAAEVAAASTLDRLRARKQELRGRSLEKYQPRGDAVGAEPLGDAPTVLTGDSPGPGAAAPAPEAAKKDDDKGSVSNNMSRLLQAKRRAKREFKDDNENEKTDAE